MQISKTFAAAALTLLMLTACQTAARKPPTFIDSQDLADAGPGHSGGATYGALGSSTIGAIVLGGVSTSDLGRSLNDIDRQRAAQAEHFALETAEPGRPQSWSNPTTNTGGTVVAGEAYDINQSQCRDYTHTITTSGGEQTLRATACRQPNGIWRSVGS